MFFVDSSADLLSSKHAEKCCSAKCTHQHVLLHWCWLGALLQLLFEAETVCQGDKQEKRGAAIFFEWQLFFSHAFWFVSGCGVELMTVPEWRPNRNEIARTSVTARLKILSLFRFMLFLPSSCWTTLESFSQTAKWNWYSTGKEMFHFKTLNLSMGTEISVVNPKSILRQLPAKTQVHLKVQSCLISSISIPGFLNQCPRNSDQLSQDSWVSIPGFLNQYPRIPESVSQDSWISVPVFLNQYPSIPESVSQDCWISIPEFLNQCDNTPESMSQNFWIGWWTLPLSTSVTIPMS